MICRDCYQGALEGVERLKIEGVSGVYHGPCGDNGKGEE